MTRHEPAAVGLAAKWPRNARQPVFLQKNERAEFDSIGAKKAGGILFILISTFSTSPQSSYLSPLQEILVAVGIDQCWIATE